jgi:hypothetical protein
MESASLGAPWVKRKASRRRSNVMTTHVIQDWTSSVVPMKYGPTRDVQYKVYKNGTRLFQEIRDVDNTPIHTLELPQGMALEKSSYEVLLRYVLVDVVNS